MTIFLSNTMTRRKEEFVPLDESNIRMYVCGPTVYDRAHIGNARPVVVFDTLYRLLKATYPKVTYVRNITDVDDKIIKRSQESGEPIASVTARKARDFATADAIRKELSDRGIILEDTPSGVRWKRA